MADTQLRPPPSTSPEVAPTSPPGSTLRRATDDRVIGGVCAGIAHSLGIDPLIVRIAAVVLALANGAGVLAYLIAWAVIPDDGGQPTTSSAASGRVAAAVAGGVLVAVGIAMLIQALIPGLERLLWPTLLIGVGLVVIAIGGRR